MINFHSEKIKFTLKNKAPLKQWITNTIEKKKRRVGEVGFVFCSDAHLLELNKTYLNHDTYTDIITFDYSQEDRKQAVSGEIFISIERVKENALKYSRSFEEELHRVMIHGILHLLGYKDKTKRAKEEMTGAENNSLKARRSFI